MARSIKVRTATSITVVEADEPIVSPPGSQISDHTPPESTTSITAKSTKPISGSKRLIGSALIVTIIATIVYAIL